MDAICQLLLMSQLSSDHSLDSFSPISVTYWNASNGPVRDITVSVPQGWKVMVLMFHYGDASREGIIFSSALPSVGDVIMAQDQYNTLTYKGYANNAMTLSTPPISGTAIVWK